MLILSKQVQKEKWRSHSIYSFIPFLLPAFFRMCSKLISVRFLFTMVQHVIKGKNSEIPLSFWLFLQNSCVNPIMCATWAIIWSQYRFDSLLGSLNGKFISYMCDLSNYMVGSSLSSLFGGFLKDIWSNNGNLGAFGEIKKSSGILSFFYGVRDPLIFSVFSWFY